MAMMWRILVAAWPLGSLGCDTEAEKQRQALEAEKAKLAAEQAEKERQEFFVQLGHWPSPDAVDDLNYAAGLNLSMLIMALIQQGADVNAENRLGWRPLHYAAKANAVDTADVLLQCGADVNAKENSGLTPLHYAAGKNAVDTTNVLLQCGADVNARGNCGQTPLHYAAQNNCF